MRGKEDATQGRKIKQLPAFSSEGPFIGSTQPWPLTGQPSSSQPHINIHVHREEVTELSHLESHQETRSTTCCCQSGRRPLSWPRQWKGGREEDQASQGLLSYQAASSLIPGGLLCVSEQQRKCPLTQQAPISLPSALSTASPAGWLAKPSPVLLWKQRYRWGLLRTVAFRTPFLSSRGCHQRI